MMWFITFILTLLFAVWLSEAEKQPFGKWLMAVVSALVLGLLGELLLPAVLPTLATYSLAGATLEETVLTHLAVAVAGVITGVVTVNIKKSLIK